MSPKDLFHARNTNFGAALRCVTYIDENILEDNPETFERIVILVKDMREHLREAQKAQNEIDKIAEAHLILKESIKELFQ